MEQPTEQSIAESGKCVGQVGFVGFKRIVVWRCLFQGIGHRFSQIGREGFGVNILAYGFWGFAGELFDHQPMFEDFKGLFNPPPLEIQIGEVVGWITEGIL